MCVGFNETKKKEWMNGFAEHRKTSTFREYIYIYVYSVLRNITFICCCMIVFFCFFKNILSPVTFENDQKSCFMLTANIICWKSCRNAYPTYCPFLFFRQSHSDPFLALHTPSDQPTTAFWKIQSAMPSSCHISCSFIPSFSGDQHSIHSLVFWFAIAVTGWPWIGSGEVNSVSLILEVVGV